MFSSDIKSAIINIDFTNHVEAMENNITGPVIIYFSSTNDRLNNTEQQIQMLQKTIFPCQTEQTHAFGGFLAASCYHIGSHETINQTYKKIQRWCASNNYDYDGGSYERYITDFWTTNNEELFVTEIIVRVSRPGKVVHRQIKLADDDLALGMDDDD